MKREVVGRAVGDGESLLVGWVTDGAAGAVLAVDSGGRGSEVGDVARSPGGEVEAACPSGRAIAVG